MTDTDSAKKWVNLWFSIFNFISYLYHNLVDIFHLSAYWYFLFINFIYERLWKQAWMTLFCVSSPLFLSKLPHYYSRHIQFSPSQTLDHCWLFIYLLFIFGQHSSDQQSLQVAFDVYQPGVNFKKTDPGPPHFCITVCRYELTRVSEIRTNLLERPPIHNTKMSHLKPFTENLS